MKRLAAVAFSVLALLVVLPVLSGAQTTGAARPQPQGIDIPGMRVAPGATPADGELPDALRSLLGSRGYAGAPVLADFDAGGDRCEIDCEACDLYEDEPPCEPEWLDIWNGGCNSTPAVFDTLVPYYGKIGLCGTSGNYTYSGMSYRDTDWFEIHVEETTSLRYCCTAEFPVNVFLIDGNAGCGSIVVLASAGGDTCAEACVEYTVAPGTYWLWVGAQVYSGIPCDAEYRITLEGFAIQGCNADCPGGAVVENEPPCGPDYYDAWNGGCNSSPYVFQRLQPSAGVITVCGRSGVYPYGGCYRDTDWYEIVLDQPREIQFCAYAEFPMAMFIIGGSCDGGLQFLEVGTAADCEQLCLTHSLSPGTYWLWIGPSTWIPIDCDRDYTMTVSGYTTAVERTTWGSVKALYR